MPELIRSARFRLAAAAGAVGVTSFLVAAGPGPLPSVLQLAGANEDLSGSCDEAEHAADPECTGTTTPAGDDDDSTTSTTVATSVPSTPAPADPAADVRSYDAAGAGTVVVAVEPTGLRLLSATPTAGWSAEVEAAAGHEVEVTFEAGTVRVDLNLELEDGEVRVRVRTRDDATGARTETENGVVVSDDDSSGPGSGSDDDSDDVDDADDDSSGPGSDDDGSDDDGTDDDSSGHGSDDTQDDTSGHGSDDGPGHD